MNEIDELRGMIDLLRKKDRKRKVFGAYRHRYRLYPPLKERVVTQFENTHNIQLPHDYRTFITTIGNGLAGPNYGLTPLTNSDHRVAEQFPYTVATDKYPEEEVCQLSEHGTDWPGVLEVSDGGCTLSYCLVVNGPSYGTVWWNDYGGHQYPTSLTFVAWYRSWLEKSIRFLEQLKDD